MVKRAFQPRFTITNAITAALTQIERARGFLEAATLSEDWVRAMSEYYDRDRAAFYGAIQSVRDRQMDMTDWLEYFTGGLSTQLGEVKQRGERAIHRDVLAREYRLSERQAKALGHVLEHGRLTLQQYAALCPAINRRTLQRDLRNLVDRGLLSERGTSPSDPTKQYVLRERK